jgi:hypothetical protein
MAQKKIELTIDEEGNTVIDVEGYTDGSCRTATDAIEKALGGVTNRQNKQGGACDVKQTIKAGS